MKTDRIQHPGEILKDLLEIRGLSQRELSSIIQIAHSHISNILNKQRDINIDIAVRLEAAGFENVKFWMEHQMNYDIENIKSDKYLVEETEIIKQWNQIQSLIPVSYFRKAGVLTNELSTNIKTIFEVYQVRNIDSFINKIENYQFTHFRKSGAFNELRNNVIAWSCFAEYKALKEEVKCNFNPESKDQLISKLRLLFIENNNLIDKTKTLLNSFGIKFSILERPATTPVDGKSFLSGNNPSIVLTLKYKRLDNFAYTLFHELGHVYKHLIKPEYQDASFFTNNTKNDVLEFEADNFARNELIREADWNDFVESHTEYKDVYIYKFAKKIGIHPAIVRGRVCFEFENYYRRSSEITSSNIIQ
jgi:HTH-type transcriptional regulator/antitoxin HigA